MARRFYIVDVFAERPYAGNVILTVQGELLSAECPAALRCGERVTTQSVSLISIGHVCSNLFRNALR